MAVMEPCRDDARALALVLAHGRTSTAFQALARGLSHWFDPVVDGVVAYFDTGSAWVAAGEPIASAAHAIDVAIRWVAAAERVGRRSCLFATEGILATSSAFRRVPIGEQPYWDPAAWPASVRGHRSFREQVRRARAKGVRVREIGVGELAREPATRAAIEAVVERWLATRSMPPMGFLVDVAPMANLAWRRLFVAEQTQTSPLLHHQTPTLHNADIVAVLSLAPVPARRGWLFEHFLRDPASPNGSLEMLIDNAMRSIGLQECHWATLGLAPLAGDVPRWLEIARRASRPIYNFDGLATFKRKLRPDGWAPIYLAYPRDRHSAPAIIDGLRAFAGGSLWSFGVRTIFRGPRPLLHALELLLVPWTIALALIPTAPWFPSAAIHWAWVAFDIGLILALHELREPRRLRRLGEFRGARSVHGTSSMGVVGGSGVAAGTRGTGRTGDSPDPSPPHARRRISRLTLARVTAAAVTIDATLTTLQAAIFTIPMANATSRLTPSATIAILIACLGPALAAIALWGAARRLAILQQ